MSGTTMTQLALAKSLKTQYLNGLTEIAQTNAKSVLNIAGRYERKFDTPLHQFSFEQYQSLLSYWTKRNSFNTSKYMLQQYLDWLSLEGIPNTGLELSKVKYSTKGLYIRVNQMFRSIDELADATYRTFFQGEGPYSNTVQEGTAFLLQQIGLSVLEVSRLKRDDIHFQETEIHTEDRVFHSIPKQFLQMIQICMDLKGRYRKRGTPVDFLESGYLFRKTVQELGTVRNIHCGKQILNTTRSIWENQAPEEYVDKLITVVGLQHAYLFSKIYEIESAHLIDLSFLSSKDEEKIHLITRYIYYWTGDTISGYSFLRGLIEEYRYWKSSLWGE